ncbi:MAG: aminopeptidase P family N-terminal domain-containing protein [Anaerotignum sp.]
MNQNRVERVLEALGKMGVSQMLMVDPMSIYYLTGVYNQPDERFYALLLRQDGRHAYFLNHLFSIPQ